MPNVRRAFGSAAAKMRVISAMKYHSQNPSEAAIMACAQALEDAAKSADGLAKHTVNMNDALISPGCMSALARDTIACLEVFDWFKIDRRADELASKKWLDELEEWGKGVVTEIDDAA
jgi:hypothetical protein